MALLLMHLFLAQTCDSCLWARPLTKAVRNFLKPGGIASWSPVSEASCSRQAEAGKWTLPAATAKHRSHCSPAKIGSDASAPPKPPKAGKIMAQYLQKAIILHTSGVQAVPKFRPLGPDENSGMLSPGDSRSQAFLRCLGLRVGIGVLKHQAWSLVGPAFTMAYGAST